MKIKSLGRDNVFPAERIDVFACVGRIEIDVQYNCVLGRCNVDHKRTSCKDGKLHSFSIIVSVYTDSLIRVS